MVIASAYELKGDRAGAIKKYEEYLATGSPEDRDIVRQKLANLKAMK